MSLVKNSEVPRIKSLSYQTSSNVTTLPAKEGVDVTLAQGEAWIPIYFTPGSIKIIDKPFGDVPGGMAEITFEYPGHDVDYMEEIQTMLSGTIIMRIELTDGEYRLMGDEFIPCVVSVAWETGNKKTAYDMKVTGPLQMID
jgi:hypothetical protein